MRVSPAGVGLILGFILGVCAGVEDVCLFGDHEEDDDAGNV